MKAVADNEPLWITWKNSLSLQDVLAEGNRSVGGGVEDLQNKLTE